MREKSRGVQLGMFGMEETPLGELPEEHRTACNLIARDVPVYGEQITVIYEMSDNTFSVAHGYAAFESEKAAQAYFERAQADMQALYGEPDESASGK